MRATRFTALVTLLCGTLAGAQANSIPTGLVTRIVDGDTLVLDTTDTVRLIGTDAPELTDARPAVAEMAGASADALSRLVLNKPVRLVYEGREKDRYGRTLAYVYLMDGIHVNEEMVQRGYAHAYTEYPFEKSRAFVMLQQFARRDGRGLWAHPESDESLQHQVQPPAAAEEPTNVVLDFGARATALYHRDTCPWVRTATPRTFTIVEARKRYFVPHCQCITGKDGPPPCDAPTAVTDPVERATPAAVAPLATPAAPVAPPGKPTGTPAPAKPAEAAPRAAPTSGRCQATTQRGTQCLRNAQPGRSYCWQHGR